jgi:hypothetical protein
MASASESLLTVKASRIHSRLISKGGAREVQKFCDRLPLPEIYRFPALRICTKEVGPSEMQEDALLNAMLRC